MQEVGERGREHRDDLTIIFATKIRIEMVARSLDAGQLAKRADPNPTSVHDIIIGKSRDPRPDTISKLGRSLGVSASQLLHCRSAEATDASATACGSDLDRVLHPTIQVLPDNRKLALLSLLRARA